MGANGGIGENITLRFAKAGYDVYATMQDPDKASENLRVSAKKIMPVDVTNPASIEAALSDFSEAKPVHALAYCIGSIDLMPLKASRDEHFTKAFEVNVLGAVRALRLLEKPLKAGQGSVVLFSSIVTYQGFVNHTVIGAAKGAIEGLAKSLAAEWAGQVRVNVIAPSLTDTALARPFTSSPQMRESIEKMHPVPRLGTSDDIGAMAQYLMGSESGWVTGQIMRVDGGRSTLRPRG